MAFGTEWCAGDRLTVMGVADAGPIRCRGPSHQTVLMYLRVVARQRVAAEPERRLTYLLAGIGLPGRAA